MPRVGLPEGLQAPGLRGRGAATEPLPPRWPSWDRVGSAGLQGLPCARNPPGTQNEELERPSWRCQGACSPFGCPRKDILPYSLWYFRFTSSKNHSTLNDSKDEKPKN